MPNQNRQRVPSIDLAFEWVKGVLNDQSHTGDVLDTKGTNLFSVATLVLGIGISAGILAVGKVELVSFIFGGLSLISYGWVIGFTFEAWRLRNYETLDNPTIIREWYWDMEPSQFKMELLSHLEDAYRANETTLSKKAKAVRSLIIATTAEVIFLVLSLAFTL